MVREGGREGGSVEGEDGRYIHIKRMKTGLRKASSFSFWCFHISCSLNLLFSSLLPSLPPSLPRQGERCYAEV